MVNNAYLQHRGGIPDEVTMRISVVLGSGAAGLALRGRYGERNDSEIPRVYRLQCQKTIESLPAGKRRRLSKTVQAKDVTTACDPLSVTMLPQNET